MSFKEVGLYIKKTKKTQDLEWVIMREHTLQKEFPLIKSFFKELNDKII